MGSQQPPCSYSEPQDWWFTLWSGLGSLAEQPAPVLCQAKSMSVAQVHRTRIWDTAQQGLGRYIRHQVSVAGTCWPACSLSISPSSYHVLSGSQMGLFISELHSSYLLCKHYGQCIPALEETLWDNKTGKDQPRKDQVNPEEDTHPWSWFPDESLAKPQDTEAHRIQVSN